MLQVYNNRILCFDIVYIFNYLFVNMYVYSNAEIGDTAASKEYIIECQCRNYTIVERMTRTRHVLIARGTPVLIGYICRALQLLTHTARIVPFSLHYMLVFLVKECLV